MPFSFSPRWQQMQDLMAEDPGRFFATLEDRERQIEAYLEQLVQGIPQIGDIVFSALATEPPGWFWLNGQTISNAQSVFPEFWLVAPVAWRSGASLILPNAKGRTFRGLDPADATCDTIAETGGSSTTIVVTHNHGSTGTVSSDHTHTLTTGGASATHIHGPGGGNQFVTTTAGGGIYAGGIGGSGANSTAADAPDHSHSGTSSGISANHTHTTADAGSSGTNANLPPYVTFYPRIRAA